MSYNINSAEKEIEIFPADTEQAPIVYVNSFMKRWKDLYSVCKAAGCPPFTLAIIGDIVWDDEMSPWAIPPIMPGDTPCTGGADKYLERLVNEIVPDVENSLSHKPSYRVLAGYSLSGLFAVYAAYHTDMFARIASVSGSLWFPDFVEYAESHELCRVPDCMYFSLGDRECRTRNKYLYTVQDNSEELARYYQSKGIPSVFELNKGNHYKDHSGRTAKGIKWVLTQA